MKYCVEVTRISYARQSVEIDAESAAQAKALAIERTPDDQFSTYETEYEISSVVLAKPTLHSAPVQRQQPK